ncbi:MAG: hypothetical protein GX351_07275, partial [Peptococcaceae bacterium]|nr:hypothetical protein [Peptococcaceae bacterium]
MGKISKKRVLATVLLVILSISGVAWFTWKTGRVFVGLIAASPAGVEVSKEKVDSKILDLPEIAVWVCQAGVYQDRKNVARAIDALKLKGQQARIIQEDPNIIALAAFPTKEQAVIQSKALAEQGIEIWIREEIYPALHFRISGKHKEEIILLLEQTNALLNGKPPETVLDEMAVDSSEFFAEKYPEDFDNLKNTLYNVLNANIGRNSEIYGRAILDLYLEYRATTKKY